MRKNKKMATCVFGGVLFALTITLLANFNLEKHYRAGEYVAAENAYFVEKIDDPAGFIKAKKYVVPTDDKYDLQKTRSLGTNLIGDIESVWSSYTGEGTTIAIIDDGFDYTHPEYTRSDGTSAILSTSRNYFMSGNNVYYESYSSDPTCIAEGWESEYNEWASHGTATSTTAAAPMNNGGGVGIAPDADILALKIDFNFASINEAIKYAVTQNVDVINMSLGAYAETFTNGFGESEEWGSTAATYLNSASLEAYNAGIIVVAAAGNEATWRKSYPACSSKVIGVGAIGDYENKGNANELAEFTNYVGASQTGEINVDILAPGYVYTAHQSGTQSKPTHIYDDTQGTSFSSPIVAGAAALWKQKYPNGTPSQFLSELQSSADGIGTYKNKMIPVSGWDYDLSDVGPSNITNGRVNVANLLDIDNPYVTTKQSNLNISVGETRQIGLNTYNGTITYSSNNTSIATVNSSGLVEGKSAGSTTVVVTATKNGLTATANVGVTVAPIVAATLISFNPQSKKLNLGQTYNAEPTLVVSPSNASRIFLFESKNENVATVDIDTGLVTAVGSGTAVIEAIAIHGIGHTSLTITVAETIPFSGIINFGSGSGRLSVSDFTVNGNDSLKNTWAVTTKGGASTYFGADAGYSQIGSGGNPASSIEFKMTLPHSVTFTAVTAKFGGFSNSVADVVIKVDSTSIGAGSVLGTADVNITNTSTASGNSLIISLSNIQKGIKAYSITYTYNDVAPSIEDVSVKNTKIYHPGEMINKSDISVTLVYSNGIENPTTDFSFLSAGYKFTYSDASSGGSNTPKQFSITYDGESYNFSVNVARVAYQASAGVSKMISSSDFNSSDLSKNINTPSKTSVTIAGVGFTVTTNAYVFSQNSTNYLSFAKIAGSINNTNAFSADLTSVSVVQKSGARQDGVLTISKNGTTWTAYSALEIAKGDYRYFKYAYIGASSGSGGAAYSNIQSISYALSGQDNPVAVSNYIMYNDTTDQCKSKLPLAIEKLNTMSTADKNLFWSSEDYVISTARERLSAWARHEEKTLTYSNGSFQISKAKDISAFFITNQASVLIPIIVISLISLFTIGGYYYLKRKKECR